MATTDAPPPPPPRSGGKILKRRTRTTPKTPHDRGPSAAQSPPNPNWLSGLIVPAKTVATNAGKFFSSLWNSESWSSDTYSSDDDDEDREEDENDNYGVPTGVFSELNQGGSPSGSIRNFTEVPQPITRKRETMRLIEKLLMLEKYSREECDRLIKIINSRKLDYSMEQGLDAEPYATDDICNQATIEAKKWFEERKAGSSSIMVKKPVTEVDAGSPVDMAKSYMRARPPWASASLKHTELRTPSPTLTEILKEGIPYSKRENLSAGSWNIHGEIQKLRSKATEDLLSSQQSRKTEFASLYPERISSLDFFSDKTVEGVNFDRSNLLIEPTPLDDSVNIVTGGISGDATSGAGSKGAASASGAAASQFGVSGGLEREQNGQQSCQANLDFNKLNNDRTGDVGERTREPVDVDVPTGEDIENGHHSSSRQELNHLSLVGKVDSPMEMQQQAKKRARPSRKPREKLK